MKINFHSAVIIVNDFDKQRDFYEKILLQKVEFDFGNCIGYHGGFSLWKLMDNYPITKALGNPFNKNGNNNFEICFETDEFEKVLELLQSIELKFLHDVEEEAWGQKTIRFYDPENNLVEVGESTYCFVKRFFDEGMDYNQVSERTSVPVEMVKKLLNG